MFGALVGALTGLLLHALTQGRRDFESVPTMQADRYELLVDEEVADEATRLLGETTLGETTPTRSWPPLDRYTGPVEKLSRREDVQLYLKGERVAAGKSAIERRPYPPGEHGRTRQRQSEYRLQLRKKQKAKRYDGVRERQFR